MPGAQAWLQGRLRRPGGCPRPCGVGSAHGQEIGRDVRGLARGQAEGCEGEGIELEHLR